jgi:hypothetical protein
MTPTTESSWPQSHLEALIIAGKVIIPPPLLVLLRRCLCRPLGRQRLLLPLLLAQLRRPRLRRRRHWLLPCNGLLLWCIPTISGCCCCCTLRASRPVCRVCCACCATRCRRRCCLLLCDRERRQLRRADWPLREEGLTQFDLARVLKFPLFTIDSARHMAQQSNSNPSMLVILLLTGARCATLQQNVLTFPGLLRKPQLKHSCHRVPRQVRCLDICPRYLYVCPR